jgi:integrase
VCVRVRPATTLHPSPLVNFPLSSIKVIISATVQFERARQIKAKTVLIKQTKLGNERRAHLPQSLIVVLANLSRSDSGRGVFWYETRNNCLMAWRRAAKRAKIAPLAFHSCRHGFATALLRAGVDVVTVAKLGGWKSARHVLETYGHANDDTTLTDLISGAGLTRSASRNARKSI